jgi:nicotinate-nucleotide adenylyltransferase
VSAAKVRLHLLKLALEDDDRFDISDIEIKRSGLSYTIDTLLSLQKLYPGVKLFFIVGGDNISDIATWKDPGSIFAAAEVAAALRPNSQPGGLFKDRVKIFNMPQIETSSSEIRKFARQGKSIKYLVPDKVEKYIRENRMYL